MRYILAVSVVRRTANARLDRGQIDELDVLAQRQLSAWVGASNREHCFPRGVVHRFLRPEPLDATEVDPALLPVDVDAKKIAPVTFRQRSVLIFRLSSQRAGKFSL